MKPFEESLAVYLKAVAPRLTPVAVYARRWRIVRDGQMRLVNTRDDGAAATHAYAIAEGQLTLLPEYLDCKAAFNADSELSAAQRVMGYWGTLNAIVQRVLHTSAVVRRGRVTFESRLAQSIIRDLRSLLSSTTIEFVARARVLGLDMTRASVRLAANLSVDRLSVRERNRRAPLVPQVPIGGIGDLSFLTFSPCEVVYRTRAPVELSKPHAVFDAANAAQREASEVLESVLSAILLVADGRIELGPRELFGGFVPHGMTLSPQAQAMMHGGAKTKLRSGDLDLLRQAYPACAQVGSDKVLARALHRFTLGRRRWELIDQLVDYVIAWEAILLTQEGSAIRQELSYRFAVNGSSLMYAITEDHSPRWWYRRMRCAYSVRSTIVHGGSDADMNRQLRSDNFTNLTELCKFLQHSFRRASVWLFSKPISKRPYRDREGWERLLWP